MPPPPINQSSSLMAVQPRAIAGELDISMTQPATFDIQNLQLALTRSQQTSSSTGLRSSFMVAWMPAKQMHILIM